MSDYIARGVRARSDGFLETAVWANTEKKLNELLAVKKRSGWFQKGDTFRRGRQIVAVIEYPGKRPEGANRRGWN